MMFFLILFTYFKMFCNTKKPVCALFFCRGGLVCVALLAAAAMYGAHRYRVAQGRAARDEYARRCAAAAAGGRAAGTDTAGRLVMPFFVAPSWSPSSYFFLFFKMHRPPPSRMDLMARETAEWRQRVDGPPTGSNNFEYEDWDEWGEAGSNSSDYEFPNEQRRYSLYENIASIYMSLDDALDDDSTNPPPPTNRPPQNDTALPPPPPPPPLLDAGFLQDYYNGRRRSSSNPPADEDAAHEGGGTNIGEQRPAAAASDPEIAAVQTGDQTALTREKSLRAFVMGRY